MNLFKWLSKTSTAKHSNLENDSSKVIDNIPKVENKTLDLWKEYNYEYQRYVTIASVKLVEIKRMNKRAVVSTEDLEKRKKAYGTCGECYKPGTGWHWCQPCNSKRFKENFNKWTSGNKNVDELIQESQLNAIHYSKCLEWIPFEQFSNVSYITRGGFGKIYSAYWPDGNIEFWDIKRQRWQRNIDQTVALKSLDNSFDISKDSLNETLERLSEELWNPNSEINPQIEECKRIRANKFKSECKPKSLQTHSQAIYTSRLINFKNLPEPVNSSPCQIFTVSECLDAQISEAMSV
ncbi:8624_t:CDS:2 [Funneliformis mosseae]|uniref:8624_t:CDS:1 n=1 Tax=Funneliformis mosseae TaxID=27381 RepID=A0A9N9AAL9_FUNMO|nr:8624_t:CDS:2 [Funneliformis mosseae]